MYCISTFNSAIFFVIFLSYTGYNYCNALSPSIKGLTDLRREFTEGENMLLTCVVSNLGDHTVIWNKVVDGTKKIIAIDKLTVYKDARVEILHDEEYIVSAPTSYNSTVKTAGGDVWVLSIKNVTEADSGGYICRVNSFPPVQSYYMVLVNAEETRSFLTPKLRSTHNYTSCCLSKGVNSKCLGFCNLHDILEGRTGIEPEKCETQFPDIVKCMADFRDHSPCCEKQGIPDICQDLCRGEYTIQDDYVKSHFSCTGFTESTLLCISEGIEFLPEAPRSPSVEVIDSRSLHVEWNPPRNNSPPFDHFVINITTIKRFDPAIDVSSQTADYGDAFGDLDSNDDIQFIMPKKMQIKVPANVTTFNIDNLTPMTWYEISVTSVNKHGSSLSVYSIRSLTTPVDAVAIKEIVTPELPDVMGCCIAKGVKHSRCLQNLCNPTQRYIHEPDMIVCAAWAQETFSCLTGGIDHSPCCRQRGLPEICINLCTGNITKIDYNYFQCVDYFSDYRSCLLQGYGVLPGSPTNVNVNNINPNFALLNWDPPAYNNNTVTSYHAYFRPLSPSRACFVSSFTENGGTSYLGIHVQSPPQVLENLCEGTKYEVYIEAFNAHGTSEPSSRIIFETLNTKKMISEENIYNASICCSAINVSPGCLPLCGYNVRMSHFRTLSQTCTPEMSKVFRCIVGGRDHRSCCKQRGVPSNCQALCSGSVGRENTPIDCLPYIGNIFMCLEEGVEQLPGPVTSLHATEVKNGSVTLQWIPPKDSTNVTNYEVHYQKIDKFSATPSTLRLNQTVNVTDPLVVLTKLEKSLYSMFVISVNEWGTSLPSSILTINATQDDNLKATIAGVSSAPHSLVLEEKTATSLTILWQPPIISLPTDRLRYNLHFATISSQNVTPSYNTTITSTTALRTDGLVPNTQYVIFVTATNDLGESRASETLLAWTDPSYPAFVETPTVHPTNLVVEGGSMTILCIAMGSPSPNVSLYISGVLYHQDVTRHMVTVVNNVTRDMTEISCFADNGYGTPMQSSVSITISHRPIITAKEVVKVVRGSEVTVECEVSAWPEPSLVWWKDVIKRIPVIHGGNRTIQTKNISKGIFQMLLTIKYAEQSDYFCHANNALGSFTHMVKVDTWDQIHQPLNVSNCCVEKGVSDFCQSACDFDQIDFHQKMNTDECIADFDKLLNCGADTSDHRGCCSKKGVPSYCLDWCRSKAIESHLNRKCLLQWAPSIFDCFSEGKETLPGPPQNIVFESLSAVMAKISWELPTKNSDSVELYRVFWRKKGTHFAMKNDTSNTHLFIQNLTEDETYEVAVKAGNHLGTSVLTKTQMFLHKMPYIYSKSTTDSSSAGLAVGICLGIVLFLGIAGFSWWMFRRRQLMMKSANSISFENPSYIREQNGDAVQIAETPNGSLHTPISTNMNIPLTNGSIVNVADLPQNGSIWNTQSVNTNLPGFEADIDPKGGYTRFKS